MTLAIQMTVRGAQYSQSLENAVRKRGQKLETFSQAITGCRVIVDMGDLRGGAGHTCNITLVLAVPGEPVVIHHRCRRRDTSDVFAGVRRIFALGERALRKHEQRRRMHSYSARAARFDASRPRFQGAERYEQAFRALGSTVAESESGTLARGLPAGG